MNTNTMYRALVVITLFCLCGCGTCNICNLAGSVNGDVQQINGGDGAGSSNTDDWTGEDAALMIFFAMGALCLICVFIAASATGMGGQ